MISDTTDTPGGFDHHACALEFIARGNAHITNYTQVWSYDSYSACIEYLQALEALRIARHHLVTAVLELAGQISRGNGDPKDFARAETLLFSLAKDQDPQ